MKKRHSNRKSRGKSRPPGNRDSRKPPRKKLVGRIQKNPRGFAFIIPEKPGEEDAYLPRSQAAELFTDDIVEYFLTRRGKDWSAKVVEILKRAHTSVIGRVIRYHHFHWIQTAEGDFKIKKHSDPDSLIDHWVIGDIQSFPTEFDTGTATVREDLGVNLKPKHDRSITVAKYSLPDAFPKLIDDDLQEAIKRGEKEIRNSENRKDLRTLPLVTIDGETAKDFDDAVFVDSPKGGAAFVLYVCIADVSFFVIPESQLDKEALTRGTSCYFPGECIPMLPEVLSNDLCSLKPKTDRLAMTAEIHFDRDANVLKAKFYPSIIRTVERLTYTQVHDYFSNDTAARENLSYIAQPMKTMMALYKRLKLQRELRGVLDFEFPESEIHLNSEGEPTDVQQAARLDSHRLIEEFMIAANREVARAFRKAKVPGIYRVHEAPDIKKLEELNHLLKTFGFSHRVEKLTSKALSKVLEKAKAGKSALTVQKAILRLQKQACYLEEPLGHFGLALQDYTHFTSPIRRYPDLMVHRALKALTKTAENVDKRLEEQKLAQIASQCSTNERKAMEAERFITKRKHCWFMKQFVGDEFKSKVVHINPYGVIVEIPEYCIEGFLPIESLKGYYEYNERSISLVKRPGSTSISIGDELTVQLIRVSVEDNDIIFAQQD